MWRRYFYVSFCLGLTLCWDGSAQAGNFFAFCDEHAAHPNDIDKPKAIEGVKTLGEHSRFFRSTLLKSCRLAAESSENQPDVAHGIGYGPSPTNMRRYYFQYGRVLEDQSKLEWAKLAYKKAADAGSAIAAESLKKLGK